MKHNARNHMQLLTTMWRTIKIHTDIYHNLYGQHIANKSQVWTEQRFKMADHPRGDAVTRRWINSTTSNRRSAAINNSCQFHWHTTFVYYKHRYARIRARYKPPTAVNKTYHMNSRPLGTILPKRAFCHRGTGYEMLIWYRLYQHCYGYTMLKMFGSGNVIYPAVVDNEHTIV